MSNHCSGTITLHPFFNPGQHEFTCVINDRRHVVIPRVHVIDQKDARPIPVFCGGLSHDLYTEYNIHTHEQEIFLYANVGDYAGYKGPQLRHQEIEVTQEVLAALFYVKMYKRERGSLWSQRCHFANLMENMATGWFLEPPPEKIEDQEFITVARDGQVVQERNPFYFKPATEGAS